MPDAKPLPALELPIGVDDVGSPRDAPSSTPRDSFSVPPATPMMETPKTARANDVAAEMGRHSTGVSVRDRTYHFTKYRKCFVGARAVEWLVKFGFAQDTVAALALGQELLTRGLIEHVHNEQRFLNRNSAFYRFTIRRRRKRTGVQTSLNIRLASALELKQRLETAETMVDDLCEGVMHLASDNESLRDCIASLETNSRAQMAAAQRSMLNHIVVMAAGAVSYVLLVEAAGLSWSTALGTVAAVAIPLFGWSMQRLDKATSVIHRSSAAAQGSLERTLSTHRPTLGVTLDVARRNDSSESSGTQDRWRSLNNLSSSDSDSDSESDSEPQNADGSPKIGCALERFSSAEQNFDPTSASPQHLRGLPPSAAEVMARRVLRRGSDTMADQHQCWSSPPPSIFTVRGSTYLEDGAKLPGSQPIFELIRCDFSLVDQDQQMSNIGAQPGTPVDLGLRAPNNGSDSDEDDIGVKVLDGPPAAAKSFAPKYFGKPIGVVQRFAPRGTC